MKNMKWVLAPTIDQTTRKALKSFSDVEAQILFNKGIFDKAAAKEFFEPEKMGFVDAEVLPNVKLAASEIIKAVQAKEKIFIYGDYDVDGVSSTSILFDFLYRGLGANVLPYIPNRFEEGYGLGETGLDAILKQEGKLVISVDCGIRDRDLVAKYSDKGLRFIITDHHTIPTDADGNLLPPDKAVAVVHPGLDAKYPFPQICATAVTWKLCCIVANLALEQGLVAKKMDMCKYLDLVALATICDIMPIIKENRALVVSGLDLIHNGKGNLGLAQIFRMAQVAPADFDAYHFGFVVGPRLNAAGRIQHALDGVRLLTSNNPEQIVNIAGQLNDLNTRRQKLTQTILDQALSAATMQVERGEQLIFVYGENWSEGVVGLVASKLNEKFYKPVLVANHNPVDGVVKGSARSIPGFDITAAISQNKDILTKFGGHNQAAGFTLNVADVQTFISNLQEIAKANINDDMAEIKLTLDAKLSAKDITREMVGFINNMQPFGYGNREPLFWFENMRVFGKPRLLGKEQKHLKFTVLTEFNLTIDVLGFNLATKLDTIAANQKYDLAGSLSINRWNGNESLQIKLKDIRISSDEKQ